MSDPYLAIYRMTCDPDLMGRITAAFAQEGSPRPAEEAYAQRWKVCAAPGFGAAWASAEAAGRLNPGADDSVITDAQLLSAIAALGPGVTDGA